MNITEIHSEPTLLQLICCHWLGDADRASSRIGSFPELISCLFQGFASEQINEGPEVPFLYFFLSPCSSLDERVLESSFPPCFNKFSHGFFNCCCCCFFYLSWEAMINYCIQQADGWQILFDIMQPWFRERALMLTPWLLHEEPWQLYCPLPKDLGIIQLAMCISESLPQPKRQLDPSSGHLPWNTIISGCGFANIWADYILTISCIQAAVAPCLCSLKAPTGADFLQNQ